VLIVAPLFCLLIVLPLGLVTQGGWNPLWLALPAGFFLFLLLGGGLGGLIWVVARRRKHLDAICLPLGLIGQPYQFWFRQYHGELDGRKVGVYFYRGPAVEIDVETTLQTRLAVAEEDSDTRFLSRLTSNERLTVDNPEIEDCWVSALDENWTRELLGAPGVSSIFQRLIAFPGAFRWRRVVLRPEVWRLTLFGIGRLFDFNFDVTAEWMQSALVDLLELARRAEVISEPSVIDLESPAEGVARQLRERNPYLVPAITFGALAIIFCLAIAFAAVVVFVTTRS
jgi:hypothetical protein